MVCSIYVYSILCEHVYSLICVPCVFNFPSAPNIFLYYYGDDDDVSMLWPFDFVFAWRSHLPPAPDSPTKISNQAPDSEGKSAFISYMPHLPPTRSRPHEKGEKRFLEEEEEGTVGQAV